MQKDEEAIRQLVNTWMVASKNRDISTVLSLVADDAIFMIPDLEPFGKQEFAANATNTKVEVDGISEIQEIEVLGEWAWMRNHLKVTITFPNGEATVHSGYTLTILRKNANGSWVIARDANLLTQQ